MWKSLTLITFTAALALAGPPAVCHPVAIGDAASLPWRNANGWDGADPSYKIANLSADTLKLLNGSAPVNVRMETLRRAAIYSARHAGVAIKLMNELEARTKSAKSDPLAWFDAGYFIEAVRQTEFIYRYDMLDAPVRSAWVHRGEKLGPDGRPMIEKALALGGKGMHHALALIDEYRSADLKHHAKR
ncbi:MAG: hypothetical protein FJW32_18625 [Acidobacteria bacterium]|nr:hypothetical protein [Acidobacteriota bacterium]